jgi:Glyoxalase/Bleomycin resistance protein/Dioxygenase superfamily
MVGNAAADRHQRFEEQRARLRSRYLKPESARPPSSARGLHHTALVSSDVERTIRFYQEQLEFPLTELIENRDYPGSSHLSVLGTPVKGWVDGLAVVPRRALAWRRWTVVGVNGGAPGAQRGRTTLTLTRSTAC